MNTISITTSQNIELEYDLGSLGDRVLGRIIDGLVLFAYSIVILAIIGFSSFFDFVAANAAIVIILILPIVFYDLISELLLNGQSIGKKVMGIKVISLTGEQPSLSQYLIRWLFRLVDFTFSGSLVALIMVAVTEKRQRLGDKIADTTLVKTKPRTQLSDTIFHPLPAAVEYKITYPEVVNLKDKDIQLVKEVITSVYKSRNLMLAHHAKERLEQVLNIRSQHFEAMDFLRTILADYNYITSQM
jgi:uncharacterized RDD family membrane protein YckC